MRYQWAVSFVTALALGIALLVVAPLAAHRLRRVRADERPFAPAKLVPPAPPRARRRAKLEDRALFGVRAAAIVALAVLGASPLVRCSRLSLSRSSGASMAVAIVIDDSMSMRVVQAGRSRFDRAKSAAVELLAGAREGDAIGVVLAGAPARVALAPTTELDAVSSVIASLRESDRATDLDGAVRMASTALASLPQVDKRVVLLSDLADGQPDAPPVGEGSPLPLWAPLEDIARDASDCGILAADDVGARVRVRIACGKSASAAGRIVEVRVGKKVIGSATAQGSDVNVDIPKDAEGGDRVAYLLGTDAIASDDAAPVLVASSASIGVVVEAADETAVTGGPPVVEQALDALRTDLATRPMPAVPDQSSDFSGIAGMIIDDPPGFTPEQRRALGAFFDNGGVVLLALGGRAASAPLGATLDPILDHATTWTPLDAKTTGVAKDAPASFLGEATRSAVDLDAKKRTTIAPGDLASLDVVLPWSDGAPLVAEKNVSRGEGIVVTLPFALGASDLPVRPAFIALLDAFVASARSHASQRRAEVGATWSLPSGVTAAVGPDGPVEIAREGGRAKLTPALVGAYRLTIDGKQELRVAAPSAKEIDVRPRRVRAPEAAAKLGATEARVDASAHVAVLLLLLLFVEMILRVRAARHARAA